MIDALVIGGGGREYEVGRQLDHSDAIRRVHFAPGNAGTEQFEKGVNHDISPTAIDALGSFAIEQDIRLAYIGPEAPIAAGVGDLLRARGIAVFAPGSEAARLESSKIHAAKFMEKYTIPQPEFKVFSNQERVEAERYVSNRSADSYVIKADGLAGGQGVELPGSSYEAVQILRGMLGGKKYSGSGKTGVVIQDRYHGPEISAFVLSDGKDFELLPIFAQDHKRLLSGDRGPNTGGMGAYASVPETILTYRQIEKIYGIADRTIDGLEREGHPYQGVIFLGLMLARETGGDPVVIEYNVRFGDPETQAIMPLLATDNNSVFEMLHSVANADLDNYLYDRAPVSCIGKTALTVCLAAPGYPDKARIKEGLTIYGLEADYLNVIIQHGATKRAGNKIVSNGGRVLYVTGAGETIDEAAAAAYAPIKNGPLGFRDMQWRDDIGWQARASIDS